VPFKRRPGAFPFHRPAPPAGAPVSPPGAPRRRIPSPAVRAARPLSCPWCSCAPITLP